MTDWLSLSWLVTGASSGLGRAIVGAVLDRGGTVAAGTRSPSAFSNSDRGSGRLLPIKLDAADAASIAAGIGEAEALLGPIGVLVNNAGYGLVGAVEETSEAEYRALFEVNFFGAVAATKAVLPGMRERGRGFIVNMSSVSGIAARAGSGFYAASKFALEGLSEALREECLPLGIETMIVEPGAFRTDFYGDARTLARSRVDAYREVARRRLSPAERLGAQPGNPDRAARIILDAMHQSPPPQRLVLGAAAARVLEAAHQRRLDEVRCQLVSAGEADFHQGLLA